MPVLSVCFAMLFSASSAAFGQQANQGTGYPPPQQLSQQQTDQLAVMGGQAPSKPVRPFPELTPEERDYMHRVLDYWQAQSEEIKLFQCRFRRFMYDTALTNHRDPETGQLSADSIAMGDIRFSAPGKALYETNALYKFDGADKPPKPITDAKLREKWVTDGEGVYEFDYQEKVLYETKLPPSMRGQGAIANSPIPFLFGANKEQILARYWVRVITPPGATDEVWLEAWPRKSEDAQNYKKVEIMLSMEPFLPKALHMYMPQYDPKNNNFSSVYISFSDRKANSMLAKLQNWTDSFVRPQLPKWERGWRRVERQPIGATAAGANPNIRQR